MRTKSYTVYKFSELSEKAQQHAIEKLSDINVDFEWYDCTYEDAKTVGIEIEGFDTYRGTIEGKLLNHAIDVARKVLKEHGETCDSHKTAKAFEEQWIAETTAQRMIDPDCEPDTSAIDEEFTHDILECYLSMLRADYEYQTSEEAIKETIEANEYEFDENGNLE